MKELMFKAVILLSLGIIQATRIRVINCAIDNYGCMPCAGYSWCPDIEKCIQPWIVKCKQEITNNSTTF